MSEPTQKTRCGFVALVGPTNAGKSTLLNEMMEEKVSIVSAKPQTTLRTVKGILNRKDSQVVFVDAPGFNQRKEKISRLLNKAANQSARDCDVVVWVFDVSRGDVMNDFKRHEKNVKELSNQAKTLCVLNKIDKVNKLDLLPMIDNLSKANVFSEIIPVSALKRDGLVHLLNCLHEYIPEGPKMYSEGQSTDRDLEFRVGEIIREKIYQTTGEEVPYSVRLEVEDWQSSEATSTPTIYVRIHVEAESQKPIIIGKRGQKLKEIGIRSRKDIEDLLGYHICLKLNVHADRDWRRDVQQLHEYLEI